MSGIAAELTRLNKEFVPAELMIDVGFFKTHLAEGLQFRRASGKVVDKSRYLDDLGAPEITNQRVEAHEMEVLSYRPCGLLAAR
ncbi:MAG TPA: hypothetical protein VN461_08850 [Vicinamibacteria bacterium]|jgi:hypothetical protein|nr:hypothetical protein [Vicinamibacteria bacterium]